MKIIAELCQNHLGQRNILEKQILAAKRSGATFAKIQGLYSGELTKRLEFEPSDNRASSKITRPYHLEFERLQKLDLSLEDEAWFVNKCKQEDIYPMITVFTHDGARRAIESGFDHFKIASYDCASIPLISKLLPYAKTLVISTGATYWAEIEETAQILTSAKHNGIEIALLHATTIYPTELHQLNLARMNLLRSFGFFVGYSDHTRPKNEGLLASLTADLLGADFLERHFTVLDQDQTKDGPISVNEQELKKIHEFSKLQQSEKAQKLREEYGQDFFKLFVEYNLEPTAIELVNRSYYRGRVASKKGGKLVYSWEADD
jgi:N,N'-diacetyllegionaminate synthase